MPNIHITSEQSAALARGENITIAPPVDELHNVVLFVKGSRASVYVWDGEVRANGHIYATRYQWLTNTLGDPTHEDVRAESGQRGIWITSRASVHIVQVGA